MSSIPEGHPESLVLNVQLDDNDEPFALINNVLIIADGDNFYVRFYQVSPPIAIQEDATIQGKLISKLAIPLKQFPLIVNAFIDNARKHEARTGEQILFLGQENKEEAA